MDSFKNLLSPLGFTTNTLQDTLKLVVIGGTVETARRASMSAWSGFIDSFFLTAHFSQDDYPYDWLMHWLSKQPAWGHSREFEITTRTVNRSSVTKETTGDLDCDEDESEALHGTRKRLVQFMPSLDTTHTIYYKGHWLRITRTKRFPDAYGGTSYELKISVVARSNDILKKLVIEAKRDYERDAEHRVHIFMADTSYGCWRWNGARQKRPMSSIVLQPGVKDMLLDDCKDFLTSEEWYAERGIPFRRGYLLHGVPGSGKTSLIHSLAGELGLDIYVVSLSSKGMSDNTLTTLMGNVPSRCILLLEDLDAAFTRSVSRDEKSTGVPTAATAEATKAAEASNDGSTLSLSGLLNSLDGVAAAEGRLLFATTNHIERLDPALSRPGRMDVWVNFSHATKWQAEGIFKCFFPHTKSDDSPSDSSDSSPSDSKAPPEDSSQKNLPISKRKHKHAIPPMTEEEISVLAKRFADAIPEDELSVAGLQGYLLKNKARPHECVEKAPEWVEQERVTRAKLKKEKEEREAKEKKEREELEKKEKEEKAAKEKEEKEAADKEKRDADRKERKSKKRDAAAALKSETATSTPVAESPSSVVATSGSEESSASESSSSSSSSESESSTGVDADTEDAMTGDEQDKETPQTEAKAEKWIAVKGTGATAKSSSDSKTP